MATPSRLKAAKSPCSSGALLTQVGAKLGVGGNLAEKLPPDAGELTILKSEQLSAAQEIAKLVRHLPVFLTLLAIILFGLAIYLAGPRRRESVGGSASPSSPPACWR